MMDQIDNRYRYYVLSGSYLRRFNFLMLLFASKPTIFGTLDPLVLFLKIRSLPVRGLPLYIIYSIGFAPTSTITICPVVNNGMYF